MFPSHCVDNQSFFNAEKLTAYENKEQKICAYILFLILLPVWTFSRLASSVGENDTFNFSVCDCDICDDECCNFSVVVTIESLETQGGITVNNATLSAIVVDNPFC